MPNHHVELTDHFDEFVSAQITEGRFRKASEVMSAGLYLLEQQSRKNEKKLARLRKLAEEGF